MDAADLRTLLSGIAGALGLWLIASPFVLEASQLLRWSNVGTGGAVSVPGWFVAFVHYSEGRFNQYAAGFAVLGGAWALLSTFVLGASGALLWSNVAVGLLVAALFGYGLYTDSAVGWRSGESSTV